MNQNLIEELKKKMEKEAKSIEKELSKFAKKDEKIEGDWDTVFPRFSGNESGSGDMEKAADEVEEYSTLLPIEHSLEIKLQNINLALDKIKRGEYGKCENCKKEISEERLKAFPEAKTCNDCK